MLRFPRRAVARFVALLRSDVAGVRAGFFALLISSGGDLVTGLTLASITHTLTELAGLFILIPAAIGMRGNIFGALARAWLGMLPAMTLAGFGALALVAWRRVRLELSAVGGVSAETVTSSSPALRTVTRRTAPTLAMSAKSRGGSVICEEP